MSAITQNELPAGPQRPQLSGDVRFGKRTQRAIVDVLGATILGVSGFMVAAPALNGAGTPTLVFAAVCAVFLGGMGLALISNAHPRQLAAPLEATPATAHRGEAIRVRLGPPGDRLPPGVKIGLVARARWHDPDGARNALEHEDWAQPVALGDGSYDVAFRIPADVPYSHEGKTYSVYWKVQAKGPRRMMRRRAVKDLRIWVEP